jgi:predicted acetyltransferase
VTEGKSRLAGTPTTNIRLIPAAREQEPILANLLELYIHDFSEFHPVDLDQAGRFGYKHLPDYWSEPGLHPFLITVDEKLAGFVLVRKVRALSSADRTVDDPVWDIAEFFIVRARRRQGAGLAAAHQVWQLFPGPWHVRVMHFNRSALHFWQRAIDTFAGHPVDPASIERDGKTWAVFTFESRAADSI